MCGRFCLSTNTLQITAHFSLQNSAVLKPRYNIAPGQIIPVIRTAKQLDFLTWGLRPSWLKPEQNPFINARLETIAEKPAFKQAFKARRCLVIANGYYEWKLIGKHKQAYFISLPQQEVFAFAAIWEQDTCAIITTNAPTNLAAVHARMPLVIPATYYDSWLNHKKPIDDLDLYSQANKLIFSASPVSTKVNNPLNDYIECTKALQ